MAYGTIWSIYSVRKTGDITAELLLFENLTTIRHGEGLLQRYAYFGKETSNSSSISFFCINFARKTA
jgi:hypothetical protein